MAITYPAELPRNEPFDVVVCGGGPTGTAAALAAARSGLRTLLVEQGGQCGGMGTSGGVSHLLGGKTNDNRAWCVAGIFKELVDELSRRGDAVHPDSIQIAESQNYSPHGWTGRVSSITYGVPIDPHGMAALIDEKLLAAGVTVLFQTSVVDVLTAGTRITSLVLYNKSGLRLQPVTAVIDATGDGDIAFRAGCETVSGRPGDGLMTPATLIFHAEGVDEVAMSAYIESTSENRFLALIKRLRAEGKWDFPYERIITVRLNQPGVYMINTSRLTGVDGTDGASLSLAMMRGRTECRQLLGILREHVPGFAHARIRFVAPSLGVRETRRIVGDWIFTVDELAAEKTYDDCIGFSGYGWDLPDPIRPSYQPMEHDPRAKRSKDHTPIPYRVLIPRPIENLIVGGRCISVERDVLGPLREQAPCMAMGQAAGTAARQVVREGRTFATVDVPLLRRELTAAGAVVDWSESVVAAGT
jgi:hypothetical protein